MIALDAGRAANGGKPPADLKFRDASIPNPRKEQRRGRSSAPSRRRGSRTSSRKSTATWKIWGNSLGALDIRVDPQNLPAGMVEKPWPEDTYAILRTDD